MPCSSTCPDHHEPLRGGLAKNRAVRSAAPLDEPFVDPSNRDLTGTQWRTWNKRVLLAALVHPHLSASHREKFNHLADTNEYLHHALSEGERKKHRIVARPIDADERYPLLYIRAGAVHSVSERRRVNRRPTPTL